MRRFCAALTIAFLVASLFLALPFDFVPTIRHTEAHASISLPFIDNFEDGTIDAWDSNTTTYATLNVTTTDTPHTGSYHLECEGSTTADWQLAYIQNNLASEETELYLRYFWKTNSTEFGNANSHGSSEIRPSGGNHFVRVTLKHNATADYWGLH